MKEEAKKFFEDNPDTKYWYYTKNVRVPNPKFYGKPGWEPDPWPEGVKSLAKSGMIQHL